MTCAVCGATLESTATSCPVCSAPVGGWRSAGPATNQPPPMGGQPPQGAAQPPPGSAPGGHPAWGAAPAHPSGLSSELRGWGVGAHLGGLLLGVATAAVLAFVGPLVVWLLKREDHPFIDHHAKEALNFQVTVLIVIFGSVLLTVPVVIVGVLTLGLGLIPIGLLVLAAIVAWFVLPIIAAVKAGNGEGYRYPFTIRFVR